MRRRRSRPHDGRGAWEGGGLHRVPVIAVAGLRVQVGSLEALDGTPVIDVKPVLDKTAER